MMQHPDPDMEFDLAHLRHGSALLTFGLVVSAWSGVILGAIAMAVPTGGIGSLGWMLGGIWSVPLFGYTFGRVGLARSRNTVMRGTGTTLVADDHPLAQLTGKLASVLNLPPPAVGIYPVEEINAFAAGSSPAKAMVSYSKGLTERMPPGAILAIAAHELAHIANQDVRRLQFATSFQKSLTWYLGFSDTLQSSARWVLGTIGELLVLRLSRQREYWADATAAAMVGKDRMIEALRCLDGDPVEPTAEHLAYARMMIRANPANWLSTHPTIAERIAALENDTFIRRLPARRINQDAPAPARQE